MNEPTLSIPPLPSGLPNTKVYETANALHSLSNRILRRARNADRESGLSPERLSLLSVLAFAGPQSIGRLSELEGVSPPAISRIVKSLEVEKFVARTQAATDKRSVLISIRPAGRRAIEMARKNRVQYIAEELGQLTTKDLATLERIAFVLPKLG